MRTVDWIVGGRNTSSRPWLERRGAGNLGNQGRPREEGEDCTKKHLDISSVGSWVGASAIVHLLFRDYLRDLCLVSAWIEDFPYIICILQHWGPGLHINRVKVEFTMSRSFDDGCSVLADTQLLPVRSTLR